MDNMKIGLALAGALENVIEGMKRVDFELLIDERRFEVSCYRVVDIIRIDLKPERKGVR